MAEKEGLLPFKLIEDGSGEVSSVIVASLVVAATPRRARRARARSAIPSGAPIRRTCRRDWFRVRGPAPDTLL